MLEGQIVLLMMLIVERPHMSMNCFSGGSNIVNLYPIPIRLQVVLAILAFLFLYQQSMSSTPPILYK